MDKLKKINTLGSLFHINQQLLSGEGKEISSVLSEIRSGKTGRDHVIKQLYYDKGLRAMVQNLILRKGGGKEDFDVVFNIALMQFVKTVVKNREIVISSSIAAYISGIAKYVWYQELAKRNKTKTEPIEGFYKLASDTTPESLVIDHSRKDLIKEILQKLRKNCREVLMYWANGYKMSEIAKSLGYKSEGMAKKKKHICFKELLLFLDKNPHVKSILR